MIFEYYWDSSIPYCDYIAIENKRSRSGIEKLVLKAD